MTAERDLVLRKLLKQKRQQAELTQKELASRMGRPQSFVSDCENGQHRISVSDFLDFADALGFDPRSAIQRVARVKGKAEPPSE